MTYLIARKISSFVSLPRFHKVWLIPSWLLLGLTRLMVLTIPFHSLAVGIGVPVGVDAWVPITSPARRARAAAIGQVVRLAARYAPWEANCLAQALTARILMGLYRVPYALFFGVARDKLTADLTAHAWVVAGPVRVTGGESFSIYTVVGMYVSPGLEA